MNVIKLNLMKYFNSVKFILFLSLSFLILGIVFIGGKYWGLRIPVIDSKIEDSTILSDLNSYPKTDGSPAQILREMQAIGALKKDFSQWYVAPQGSPSGQGTINSPWDLTTALEGGVKKTEIKPGDVIWLRGGRYAGTFTVRVQGRDGAPVHLRQYPNERAVIEKNEASRETAALNVRASNVWFWDFEVTNSFSDRRPLDASNELNPWRGSGINIWETNTKYINLKIHDNGHGFGLWNEDGGTEIYGCLIFNNGNNKKEHGVYAHNKTGTHLISDNLIFNNAGYGLHIYANSMKSSVSGFNIEGNAIFNNGALTADDQVADQILVGGVEGVSAGRIALSENFIYNFPDAPTSKNRGIRLGYENENNSDVKILNNYIVSRVALKILWWQSVEARSNTILSVGKRIEIETPANVNLSDYKFDSNKYPFSEKNSPTFSLNKRKIDFGEWQQINKFDVTVRADFSADLNQAGQIFVRLNKYNKSRANIIVFNPSKSSDVAVKLNNFLQIGDTFEVRDAQNYFAEPVLQGTFDGKAIILPMVSENATMPIGNTERKPVHTSSDFAVFVIYKSDKNAEKNSK